MRQRNFMLVVLIVLLAILAALVFLYLKLSQPPRDSVAQQNTNGITWIRSIYGYGKKPNELLNAPTGVGVDSRRRIVVADSQNRRVLVFERDGRFVGRLGTSGMARGQIEYPQGVDVGPDDEIYVADPKRNVLMVFDSDLKFKDEIHGESPLASFATKDKIYLATMQHIVVLDKSLRVLDKWGKRGKAIGEFDFPHGVLQLKNGSLLVSDGNNMRLQALVNGKGEASWVVGEPPNSMFTKTRAFGLPAGIAVNEAEQIYVMDPLRSSVHVFNNKGKALGEYGEIGPGDGQFSYPSDIAYMGDAEFAVSDTFNNRVQVVRIGPGGPLGVGAAASLWELLKDFWWCALLLLLLLAAMLFVYFRRRGAVAA